MIARRPARLALTAGVLCGLARPAFADGALGGLEAFGQLAIAVFVLALFVLLIVALIAIGIHSARKPPADERTETAESPELPEARVWNDRSRSGPEQ
jgi:hypothetical protein